MSSGVDHEVTGRELKRSKKVFMLLNYILDVSFLKLLEDVSFILLVRFVFIKIKIKIYIRLWNAFIRSFCALIKLIRSKIFE